MPPELVTPTLLVAGLGLVASLCWGVADFGGGLASRRAPVAGVLFTSQAASLLVAIPLALLAIEPAMRPIDIAIAGVAGVLGASGLALLYRGLSVGRMGVVAPIAAVITAAMPIAFGLLTDGLPPPLAIVGIGCAAVGVVLVSLSPAPADGRPSGLWYGVGTGLVFGLFPIVTSGLNEELLVGPVVTVRIASVLSIALFLLIRRTQWRVPRRLWPAMFALGVVDMAATAAFLAAIAVGPLAIAAILSSMYPVVTVLLAAIILRERMTAVHIVGIVAAALAVVLIAAA